MPETAPGFFHVMLDAKPLGDFTAVSGLSMSIETEAVEEGGNFFFQHSLHKTIKYDDVTLTRNMGIDSNLIGPMFQTQRFNPLPSTAEITLMTPDGVPMVSWALMGVRLKSWKGPQLDITSWSKGAQETITLSHQGFLGGGLGAAIGAVGKAIGL